MSIKKKNLFLLVKNYRNLVLNKFLLLKYQQQQKITFLLKSPKKIMFFLVLSHGITLYGQAHKETCTERNKGI